MDALSARGAVNCLIVGLLFGMGFHIAGNILRFIASLIGAR